MIARLAAFIGLFLCLSVGLAHAQDPMVNVTTDEDEVIVGQPFLVRVDVLVPTFMPKAPVFPSFEVPGLIVRLPERSTSPISERVDGATWSGVRRTYRLYPTREGIIEIPPQEISITYKNTAANEDVPLTVNVPAIRFAATVPPGASALDPLIIAQGLSIEQSWQAEEGTRAVGDAIVRRLEIAVSGTSALFVPPLLEDAPPQAVMAQTSESPEEDAPPSAAAFLAYPEDARVTESFERGEMSGTRTEQVAYIAQSGGEAQFPDIVLSWYNLDTEKVEEIMLPGRSVSVAMPPVVRQPFDRAVALRIALLLGILALAIWAARRWFWPLVHPRVLGLKARYTASPYAAHRNALNRAKAHDLTGLLNALDVRTERGLRTGTTLQHKIDKLTVAIYRDGLDTQSAAHLWNAIQKSLRHDGPGVFNSRRRSRSQGLPALNPFAEGGRKPN